MRLPVVFAKVALIGLLTYGALPVSHMLAEETNQPRVIGDARLAACINQLAQNMVRDGVARVPFTIKIEPSDQVAWGQQAKVVGDPANVACIDLLAQNVERNGAARVPFAIRITPAR